MPSAPVPAAPWRLGGGASAVVLGWVRVPRSVSLGALLPAGVSVLPGVRWGALVGASYSASPVGPYVEMSLAVPARLGLRPGLCVVTGAVSSAAARSAYRGFWGVPVGLGALTFRVEDMAGGAACSWPEMGWRVEGRPLGMRFPVALPVRSVQRRSDGPILLPRRLWGWMRFAGVEVSCTPGPGGAGVGDWAWVSSASRPSGRWPGAVLTGVNIVASAARTPAGVWSSLRAPLGAAEPAVASRVTAPPGAYSSVG